MLRARLALAIPRKDDVSGLTGSDISHGQARNDGREFEFVTAFNNSVSNLFGDHGLKCVSGGDIDKQESVGVGGIDRVGQGISQLQRRLQQDINCGKQIR